jgi:hypothetical protein
MNLSCLFGHSHEKNIIITRYKDLTSLFTAKKVIKCRICSKITFEKTLVNYDGVRELINKLHNKNTQGFKIVLSPEFTEAIYGNRAIYHAEIQQLEKLIGA